jgi:hypothetical protein
MKPQTENKRMRRIKISIWMMITGLTISGLTAFPIGTELRWLIYLRSDLPEGMSEWLYTVYIAVMKTNQQYPYLSYGTDWLAFAHLMLAILFIGPLRDPVKNSWVIEFGMIACLLIIPLAFIAGYIRHIPIFWRIIDCSFGVFGIIPLMICYKNIKLLKSR